MINIERGRSLLEIPCFLGFLSLVQALLVKLPCFLCTFPLTSTGQVAQIETANRKLPQVIPVL